MRFTLRDLLWLMLALGLALGWLIHAERLNEKIAKARIDVMRAEAERDGMKTIAGPYAGHGSPPKASN
jgi:uncharacterized membrane protein YciS (DUF1049 family)